MYVSQQIDAVIVASVSRKERMYDHVSLVSLHITSGQPQPRSLAVLTSYADHEAEWTTWYTSIQYPQKMDALAAIMALQFAWQR